MKISIFGLGYVGCVSLGMLAKMGHKVIGVEISKQKVDLINSGKSTIVEEEIEQVISDYRKKSKIKATTDVIEAISESEVAIICVGTPNKSNGLLDMKHIYSVAKDIGNALSDKNGFFTIAIRSTVMPGTNKMISEIVEKQSGKKNLKDFAVVSNPEFLREGTAVKDFLNPPFTVIASDSEKGISVMKKVYSEINADIVTPSVGSAELIKFVNNSFHALKIDFANEVGKIAKSLNTDGKELMELFVKDDKLNISPYYLKPGLPYGGSCLPKDLRALQTIARDKYLDVPVIESIDRSNDQHLKFILNTIIEKGKRNIGFFGLSFKPGTDDLRFSPAVELAERLIGKGYNIKIYDKNVILSRLKGKNKQFLLQKLPHINNILVDSFAEFMKSLELIVIINNREELIKLMTGIDKNELMILDGTSSSFETSETGLNFEALC